MPVDNLVSSPVFLALTTTEPNGEGDLVCVRAQRETSLPAFERLIQAPHLTLSQLRLTGLTNAQLDAAPDLDEVLQDLIDYCKDSDACVVAAGRAGRTVLASAARSVGIPRLPLPELLGIDELAAIVHPKVGRRGIAEIQEFYQISDVSDEPGTLQALWLRLEEDLLKLPLPLLAEMSWMLHKSEHPLRTLLKSAETHAVKSQFTETFNSGKLSLDKLFKDFSPIINRLLPEGEGGQDAPHEEPCEPVTESQIEHLLGTKGPLAAGLEGYEERREQIEMAKHVATALSEGKHLMAEAGTGVGKSLAYLIPAILFSKKAGRPVMISTHTKNLQSQLFHKDLPLLREHLGEDFKAALLKGRSNYLCLRKFMYTLQESAHELNEEERAQILPIMSWATQTEDGDVAEMAAFSSEVNHELWDRLHTVGDDCLKRQCPFYNRCFVYKARGNARGADVVVLNHSLVFSDLNLEAGTLPPYSEIVFDEAHKLEEVATEHLACEVTPRRVYKILNRLFRIPPGSSAGKGLLPSLLGNVEQAKSEFKEDLLLSIREHILNAMQAVDPANDGSNLFFNMMRDWTERPTAGPDDEALGEFIPMERGRGGVGLVQHKDADLASPPIPFKIKRSPRQGGDDRKRFSSKTLSPGDAENMKSGKEAIIATLGRLRQSLDVLDEDFKEIRKRTVPRARELSKEISAQNLFLTELISDIEFVVKGDEANYVYWVERLGRRSARAVAAPLDVSALLHDQLYERKRSIIFTSATLSVRDVDAGSAAGLAPLNLKKNLGGPFQRVDLGRPTPDAVPQTPDSKFRSLNAELKPHPKSFEFLKNRTGLSLCSPEKLDELLLGSPFDYRQQCRLYVPSFIPEPGGFREKEYLEKFTAMVSELILASGGRAMILYTSYSALEASARVLRKTLTPEGIEVLAQGSDGSRESLLARLKAGGRSVLLGTASFWEGVDVRGDALSLLVIAKLPFAVFTDPIIQGRCELLEASGKDAFLHFSVPNAILKLRQGFGRLIRSKSDRGVIVLADKRVLTKRYGAAFLRSLPAAACTMTSQEALTSAVKEFLGRT